MIYIQKGSLETNVPIISQILCAIDKSIIVKVICSKCDEKTYDKLTELGVKIVCSNHKPFGFSILKKVSDWILFRIKSKKILNSLYEKDELIVIGSADTAIAYGKSLLKYKYVLNIRELYDKLPRYLRAIRVYAQNARCVVIPEFCRANILKNWLKLKKNPLVIPNKPYSHPKIKNIDINNYEASTLVKQLDGKKLIIYQGLIDKDRNLVKIVEAFKKINDDNYAILLMGKETCNIVSELKNIYKNTYHIKYIPAPFHLEVTSHAYIGIVNYDDSSLNNIFCAPNKIFEYSGFGIPTLARDIPGIRYTIGIASAGVCVDFDNIDKIVEAINKIENNYNYFAEKSLQFFDDLDLHMLFDEMINS